uniref:Arf-GAP domain-containing protein n=1 Tax=Maylandia zebra TaxID=106582 RepID=A0A3P9DTV4_9CICH
QASALSCCQVALRLWEHPYNKVCGDCGAANPEWASVNLLLVICQHCAGMTAHLVHVKIINAEGCVTAE